MCRFDDNRLFTRCSDCNAEAFKPLVPKELARPLVSARVYELVEDFRQCGQCEKIFWTGPRSVSAIRKMKELLLETNTL